jgi:SAM-dependent methyltransferase
MEFTQEQLISAGYKLKAAPRDAWRNYAEQDPIPGYFQFDWLSARHPDLYHQFALSTIGLMNELNKLIDLTGLDVLDVGAGTGRSTIEAAKKAKKVIALDYYESVASYGKEQVSCAGLKNVNYLLGDRNHLPLPDNCMDATICSWAILNLEEAFRVLKPGGCLILLGAPLAALCGELTPLLADVYPEIITEIAPPRQLDPACPDSDSVIQDDTWNGIPVAAPILVHDFTYIADYGNFIEAAAILGRLYGPRAKSYMIDRRQATLSWRLSITICRVNKI